MVELKLYENPDYKPNKELDNLTSAFKYVFKQYNQFINGEDYIPAGKIQFKNNLSQKKMYDQIFHMNFPMLKAKAQIRKNYQQKIN